MDKGMKKVVNLVTNYMAAEVMESPEDCARVLNGYFL